MIQFDTGPLLIPTLLVGAASLAACAWMYRSAARQVDPGPRLRIISCRIVAVLGIIVFLVNPRWVDSSSKTSAIAVIVDESGSMQTRDEGRQRSALAAGVLDSSVLPSLPAAADVELYVWRDGLVRVKSVSNVASTGTSSDLPAAMTDAFALPRNRPLSGIVLLSDGAFRSPTSLESAAGFWKRKGIPVHTIAVGAGEEPRDLVLESAECRSRLPVGRPARLTYIVRSPGYANSAVAVELRDGGRVLATDTLYLNGQSQGATLSFTPHDKGFHHYEIAIAPQPGERSTENNRRLVGTDVVEPLIRVHYQEGSGDGEATYLKKALETDPAIKVTVPQPMTKFPETMAEMLQYDVIIDSDIPKSAYTQQQQDNTARFVVDYGGGYVMIGGHTAFGSGGWNRTVVDRIIPVAMEEERGSGGEFTLAITPDALNHPVMQMKDTQAENKEFWEAKLPRFFGFDKVDHAKPGATVLAAHPTERNRFGPLVIIAAQEIGRGRSLAFTTDSTRAWGAWFESEWGEPINPSQGSGEGNNDTRYYKRFWINAVRWLAENRLSRSTAPVSIDLSRNTAFTGEEVRANVRVQDANLNPKGDAEVSIRVTGPEELPLKASFDEAAGVYPATFTPNAAGDYLVSATVKRPGEKPEDVKARVRVEQVDAEMFDVRPRPELLARLSSITGGVSVSADDHELGTRLADAIRIPPESPVRDLASIWDRWPVLLVLLGVIAAEWIIRRRNGLA